MTRQTRQLAIFNTSTFMDKLSAFNRKAVKLGFEPAEVLSSEQYSERDPLWGEWVFICHHVTLAYDVPRLPGGWQLVASLDHQEKLVRTVPGEQLPAGYAADDNWCDHCGTRRYRTETFIVRNDQGATKQVGRNCLGDFLGIDAGLLLRQIDLVRGLGDEEWQGQRQPSGLDLRFFLAHVACMMRSEGWTSRGEAKEGYGKIATSDRAWDNIDNQWAKTESRYGEPLWTDPTEADGLLAERTVAWMGKLAERSDLDDYLSNLAQIAENDYVTRRSAGFAASAINAMLKEEAEELERRTTSKRHLGEVGQKLTGDFTLVRSYGKETQWGVSFCHNFKDAEGNTVIWWTGTELEPGKTYRLSAKIKELGDYKGVPQTVVTRAKVA